MKKLRSFAAIVAVSLTLVSCGFGTTGTTGTTTNDSNAALQQAGADILGTVLSSILGNTTSQQSLVGAWTYSGPKVVFESENILSQLGGQVISSNFESKLGTQLSKMGFSAGKSVFTLNNDGTCTLTLGSKTLDGTYAYDASSHKLTLTDVLGLGQMTCTASVQTGQLMMLFEADKLLAVATSISSKSTSSLSSLLQSYTGLKLGWAMSK
ncbi:MAG: DUF4923 family protein [Bacteroidaceae bacterium]|nr:DUF4923 family protein [Bacteroidaceae bacterium]